MAIEKRLTLLLLSVLSLLGTYHGAYSYGEKKNLQFNKVVSRKQQTSPVPTCFTPKSRRENGAIILEMKHGDYCSRPVEDWNERHQKRLVSDIIRVRSLQLRIKKMVSNQSFQDLLQTQIPLTSGINLQTLNYIVTVQLGGNNMTVIVDTGSDLTWVQCQPCRLCYNQPQPLFNPSLSPSYQSVLCNSSACQSLEFATGNSGFCGRGNPQTCNYVVSYGDGSYTQGELGQEQLVLGTTVVKDFVFGCGRNNKGLFGGASGLIGLGRSDLSMISQTKYIFGGVFSYCLPSTEAEASGSLTFGGDSSVYKNSSPIAYTRIVPNPQLETYYFVNVTGIRIGDVPLQSPSFGKGGILIDSGTVITRLPPSIYKAVKAEFLKQFSGFPSAPGFMILDTCFNLSAFEEVDIPTIRMQFEGGAELNVDVHGVLYFVKSDASQICLALASLAYEDEIGIIGNYQQRNTRVVYDSEKSILGFGKEACSFMGN